jgi:hypothetical protein
VIKSVNLSGSESVDSEPEIRSGGSAFRQDIGDRSLTT